MSEIMGTQMRETARMVIPAGRVRSLCWQGDELVDWAAGGTRYRLDGTLSRPTVNYAYRFDAAVASHEGTHAVLYERLGTKGLVLRDGKVLREINRSFYHASAYEYPVAIVRLPDDRVLLAHCPDSYCKIELEEFETGKRLTERKSEPRDFFHSRLQASPDGKLLLSAGWVWHPLDAVCVYDIVEALARPETLDTYGIVSKHLGDWPDVEANSAAFDGADRIVMTSSEELLNDDDSYLLRPLSIGAYRVSAHRFESMAKLEEIAGTLMPVGEFAVGFFEHPKLIELATGKVVARWPDIASGRQTSSIVNHIEGLPVIALDPARRCFAVAGSDSITVIQLG